MPLSKHFLSLKSNESKSSNKTNSTQQSHKTGKTNSLRSFKRGNSSHDSSSKHSLKIQQKTDNKKKIQTKSLNLPNSSVGTSQGTEILTEEPKSISKTNNEESKNSDTNKELNSSEKVNNENSVISSQNQLQSSNSSLNTPFNVGEISGENSSVNQIIVNEDENSSLDNRNNSSTNVKSRFCFCC
jgi:hypothetical protein